MNRISVDQPVLVRLQAEPGGAFESILGGDPRVRLTEQADGLRVAVSAPSVARLSLRWSLPTAEGSLVLGDAWERSYGELEWRSVRAERVLPWYALVHTPDGATRGFGVRVRGGAFAFWQVDATGVTLTLDLRSGGAATRPGDREIHAATVCWSRSEGSASSAQRDLMGLLCSDPITDVGPLVGANNWYYAYGQGFDLDAVVGDAKTVAELVGDHPVRPYGVIDDGWSVNGCGDGHETSAGPWDRGRGSFAEMSEAAAAIAAQGVRPGLWYRPLVSKDPAVAGVRGHHLGAAMVDPTAPETRDRVAEDLQRFAGWGFDLVKHDFSTLDLFDRWGAAWGAEPGGGAPLLDDSVTSAEALVNFYSLIREAAGPMVVLGCNVVGHLAAGLVHAQRIGDDTSGREWDRTRRIGVNTLAFRLAQHGTFFVADADCVPSTPQTDWALNRRFLDLVARSGTALFVSVDPSTRSDAVDADLSAALRLALDGGVPGGIEPLDWLTSPTPSRWRSGADEVVHDWLAPGGADPLEQPRFETYPA